MGSQRKWISRFMEFSTTDSDLDVLCFNFFKIFKKDSKIHLESTKFENQCIKIC